jgi:hypothetical protein
MVNVMDRLVHDLRDTYLVAVSRCVSRTRACDDGQGKWGWMLLSHQCCTGVENSRRESRARENYFFVSNGPASSPNVSLHSICLGCTRCEPPT